MARGGGRGEETQGLWSSWGEGLRVQGEGHVSRRDRGSCGSVSALIFKSTLDMEERETSAFESLVFPLDGGGIENAHYCTFDYT